MRDCMVNAHIIFDGDVSHLDDMVRQSIASCAESVNDFETNCEKCGAAKFKENFEMVTDAIHRLPNYLLITPKLQNDAVLGELIDPGNRRSGRHPNNKVLKLKEQMVLTEMDGSNSKFELCSLVQRPGWSGIYGGHFTAHRTVVLEGGKRWASFNDGNVQILPAGRIASVEGSDGVQHSTLFS